MASGPVYSVSFMGTTKNYYVGVAADAGESARQFGELVEDFSPHVTFMSFFLRPRGGGPRVEFSPSLRGDFEIVLTQGSCRQCAAEP